MHIRPLLPGLSTIVIEKTHRFGGTSAYSGASIWLPGTAVQERAGLPDSTENARTYLRAVLGDSESDRQDAYVDTAPAVVALLEKNPHIEFEWRAFPDYYKAAGRMDYGRAINPLDLPTRRRRGPRARSFVPRPIDRPAGDHAPGNAERWPRPDRPSPGGRSGTGHAELRTETAAPR